MLKNVYKKVIAISMIMLISISSFAAVVEDNDGSAFITKMEFDSLNSEFQARLNEYNTGIDAKIENAIASYFSTYDSKSEYNVKSLLDANGYYGGFLEKWSSATGKAFDETQNKYSRDTFNYFHNMQDSLAIVSIVEPIYNNSWTSDSLDYWTSKRVKIELNNGTVIDYAMQRMKITTSFVMSMWELKADWDSSSGSASGWEGPSALRDNIKNNTSSITQNKSNITIVTQDSNGTNPSSGVTIPSQFSGKTYDWVQPWTAYANISTSTNEVSYTYAKENINYPLSNTYDYFWDPNNTSSIVMSNTTGGSDSYGYYGRPSNISNWDTNAHFSNTGFGIGQPISSWTHIWPYIPYRMRLPWCGVTHSYVSAGEEYLQHWNKASTKNRKVKNGIYIGETNADGDMTITANTDVYGTLYVYFGENDSVVSTWAAGEDIKAFSLEPNKDGKCEIKDVKKGKEIRMMFLPTSTSDIGTLKIKSIKIKEK